MGQTRRRTIAIAIIAAVLAIAAPVAVALYFAQQQALGEQKATASSIAADVLRRADETGVQIGNDFKALAKAGAPCSPTSLRRMTSLAASSEQLQGLGYVVADRLVCSSLGVLADGAMIGPPSYRSAFGIWLRPAVAFPAIPGVRFIVTTDPSSGFTAIIHPKLPIDVFTADPHIAVGIFGSSARIPLTHRGDFAVGWARGLRPGAATVFLDGDRLVAVQRSAHGDYSAYAAIPATGVSAALRREALILAPIGLAAGAILAAAVVALVRLQTGIKATLRGGLRRRELFAVYQPIVDLHTGAWIGAEALLRWQRPSGDLIRPDIFIPMAEESGLIGKVSARMMELVGADAAGLFRRHPDFYLSVNLSAEDLESEHTVDRLMRLMEQTGGGDGNILVEATERSLLHSDANRRVLSTLRAQGLQVGIDDFGTGFSSLSYLQSFDLDVLKIDKVFIDTVGANAATSHVVPHIIAMAHDLGLELIAEGVETEAQAAYLRANGVRYAQGWLFAKAMPFADLSAHLEGQAHAAWRPGLAAPEITPGAGCAP